MATRENMIERVARALAFNLCPNEKLPNKIDQFTSVDVGVEVGREIYIMDLARAAIEAMREPTEAMGAAAEECPDDCWGTWSTMIDSALHPKEVT